MWHDWDSALTAEFANCFEAFLRFITHDHSCSRRTFFRTVYNVSLASTRALPAPGVCVVFIKYILIKFSPFPSLLRSSSTPIYITPLPPCSVNVSPSLPSFKKKSSKQKPIRQKKCQNRTRWKRSYTQKIKRKRTWIHGIYFALANCFWLWGLPWSMADTHSNTPWRKLIFTFPEADTCKQLLGWGWDPCPHSPPSARTLSGLNVYRHCACCHSLCNFIWASVPLFPWSHHHVWLLQCYCLFFCIDPRELMGRVWWGHSI